MCVVKVQRWEEVRSDSGRGLRRTELPLAGKKKRARGAEETERARAVVARDAWHERGRPYRIVLYDSIHVLVHVYVCTKTKSYFHNSCSSCIHFAIRLWKPECYAGLELRHVFIAEICVYQCCFQLSLP